MDKWLKRYKQNTETRGSRKVVKNAKRGNKAKLDQIPYKRTRRTSPCCNMTASDAFCQTRFTCSPSTKDNNSQSRRGQAWPNSIRDTDDLAIRSDSDLPGPRPATRHSAHEYFTISGRGRDPRGEVTRTLDDASESWTKANRENAGAVPTRGYRDKGCRWERAQRPRRGSRR